MYKIQVQLDIYVLMYMRVQVLVAQSCLILCDHMDCSLPGSSIHGSLHAGALEWVAILCVCVCVCVCVYVYM